MNNVNPTKPEAEESVEVPRDSLKKRYVFKIVSNFIGLISNVFVQAIAPRSLGPQAFGDFNFLTSFFDQVLEIADGRSSVGALVKVSLRPNETGLVVFYLYFSLLVTAFVFASVGAIFFFDLDQVIWPGQLGKFVFLAALWSVVVWLHGVLQKLCDAFGYTREAEWIRIQQRLISVVVLGAMFYFDAINLETFFYYYVALLFYLLFGFGMILFLKGRWPSLKDWKLPLSRFKSYAAEFYVYASPLFVYVAIESVVVVLDRWVLQKFSGSQEQGYFGFAYQMGYVSILFVGAISPLIQREFSVAHAAKNFTHMAYLFTRYMPMLFSISAFFTGFIVFQSEKLVHLFAGSQFSESILVITIMAFYPMYFTFGRVTSSVFYATGETQLFRNLGLLVQGVGLVMTWVLIAPRPLGGLELGANGLAIKLVIVQTILVNIQVWFSCRLLHMDFKYFFQHQLFSVASFIAMGFVATLVTDKLLFSESDPFLAKFVVGGMIYCLLVSLFGYVLPRIFGIYRSDISFLISYVFRKLKLGSDDTRKNSELRSIAQENIDDDRGESKLRVVILGARNSIHAVRWANGIAGRGHEVHLISLHGPANDILDHRVMEHSLPFGPPWGYFLNVPKLVKIFRHLKPDVIHVHYASGYGTLANLSTPKNFILSAWGSDIFDIPRRSLVYRFLVRSALNKASLVTAASRALGHAVEKELKGKKPVYVVPFGVDVDQFFPRDDERSKHSIRIGLVKSLEATYGIDLLIRAFAMVCEWEKEFRLGLNLELVLIGKGNQFPLLASMAKSLGIEHRTFFKGSLPHDQISEALREMDIFVAPSRSESFGVSLIEASACGLPIIASRVGGIPEVVEDGVTGLIIESESVEALAQALWRLVGDGELRIQLGKAGREKILREFNWLTNIKGMEGLYFKYRN